MSSVLIILLVCVFGVGALYLISTVWSKCVEKCMDMLDDTDEPL